MEEITKLASEVHDVWGEWFMHVFRVSKHNSDGSLTIPAEYVVRWKRQSKQAFSDLSLEEKLSDIAIAVRYLRVILEGGKK